MKNECLDVALQELSAAGIRDVTRSYGSKHQQVRWRVNGRERMYTIPVSPSDVRSAINTRTAVRRMLREDGLAITAERKPPPPKQPDRATILERRMVSLEQQLAALGNQIAVLEQQLAALSKQMNGAS